MTATDAQGLVPPSRLGGFHKLMGDPMGLLGLGLAVLLILSAVLAPWIAPYGPNAMDIPSKLQGPSAAHWLGTDQLGRDVLSRALYGGRIALSVALVSTALSVIIGGILGMAAAMGPRWLDYLLTLGFDTVRAYPVIILALAIVPIFGGGMVVLVGLLVATSVPYYGRIMRASVLAQANAEYVEALRAMGAGRVRIVARHILPNVIGPVLIVASMDIPAFIAAEAGLSFLGVGVKPPASSWGLMLQDGFDFVGHTPWLVVAGGIPLVLATLGFTFLGEALRDAFDPKLVGKG
ncbi:ABC transporter permease [Leisingera sp. S132]|uniref:ABC transporter permease n=1 Tax=Leisingera sp. S132 TaxID=2867016 RepID=UPI0021A5C18C|nr:ABC transporter permease [Leisingera sp. S132]UWQ79868.1 ABC transporter permease [Leisingera sp. S132]